MLCTKMEKWIQCEKNDKDRMTGDRLERGDGDECGPSLWDRPRSRNRRKKMWSGREEGN